MLSATCLMGMTWLALQVAVFAEPQTASVGPGGGVLLSGPDASYYPADEIAPGERLDVFQRLESGYCAVRPPEGSFSWVPAADFEIQGDVGRATRAGVPCRVGSRLEPDALDAVHVRLELGETVQVMERVERDGIEWLKIAPPAGEFRWIRSSELANNNPQSAKPEIAVMDQQAPTAGWVRAAAHQEELAAPPLADRYAAPAPLRPAAAPPATEAPIARGATSPPDSFERRLAATEVRLSRIVSDNPTLWRFDGVRVQVQELAQQARTDLERVAVSDLSTRVAKFERLARRVSGGPSPSLASSRAPSRAPAAAGQVASAPRRFPGQAPALSQAPAARQVAQQRSGVSPNARPAAPGSSEYDVVGVLRPVVSSRPGFPTYAVIDDTGRVVSLLTPGVDLNLGPMVGKRVGVRGSRGFMPEYDQAHVTANRVTPLEPILR